MATENLTDAQISSGECLAMCAYHLGMIQGIALAKYANPSANHSEAIERTKFHFNEAEALLARAREKFESAVSGP